VSYFQQNNSLRRSSANSTTFTTPRKDTFLPLDYVLARLLSLPAVVLDHVRQLYDVFTLFVLLCVLESSFIFPAQRGLAALAVDVGHGVEARQQHALLRGPAPHVHDRVEQVGAALAALERLADDLGVAGEVRAAVHAGVGALVRGQVRLERLDHSGRGARPHTPRVGGRGVVEGEGGRAPSPRRGGGRGGRGGAQGARGRQT